MPRLTKPVGPNGTTQLGHPRLPDDVVKDMFDRYEWDFLVTACCERGHHTPLWAFRSYGLARVERRCNGCGALIVLDQPKLNT